MAIFLTIVWVFVALMGLFGVWHQGLCMAVSWVANKSIDKSDQDEGLKHAYDALHASSAYFVAAIFGLILIQTLKG